MNAIPAAKRGTWLRLALLLLPALQPAQAEEPVIKSAGDYASDLKDYVFAPFRMDRQDLRWAGTAIAATALAYALDNEVRTKQPAPGSAPAQSNTLRDALPLVLMTAGTFAAGELRQDSEMAATGADMAEAAVLAIFGTGVLKVATGRLRPDEAVDRGEWFKGGDSFPSGHVAATFAAVQVLSDRLPVDKQALRWTAYGLAGVTAVARIAGNNHWLSDTVAGAALGMATGRFISERRLGTFHNLQVGIAPGHAGLELAFSASYN